MIENAPKSKICPSCRGLTPPELQIKRFSRSSGKKQCHFVAKLVMKKVDK